MAVNSSHYIDVRWIKDSRYPNKKKSLLSVISYCKLGDIKMTKNIDITIILEALFLRNITSQNGYLKNNAQICIPISLCFTS